MILFDTHCHLQDPAFDDVGAVIQRARAAGVGGMTICGYDLASSFRAVELAAEHDLLYPAAGIHPHDAGTVTSDDLDAIRSLAHEGQVVAVGELGLDFYRDLSPRERQVEVLEAQLAVATEAALPVCVHSRGAEDAIREHLQRYAARSPLAASRRHPGVMHCFGGTLEQARWYVEMGFLISIPCSVTYPKNDEGRRIAGELPVDCLVVETDSPYLPPQGRRGTRNEPALVGAAVQAIATVRGMAPEDVATITTQNAQRLYGVVVEESAGARAR